MRHLYLILSCLTLSGIFQASASAQEKILSELNPQEFKTLQAPYEFRIASFSKDEGKYGSGPMVLLITNDMRTAVISLHGVKTELQLMQKVVVPTCVTGSSRQQIYAKDQLRLMLKLTLTAGAEACWAEGLVSIRSDKHTNRYMVKGVSGL